MTRWYLQWALALALIAAAAAAEQGCDCSNLSLAPAPVCGGLGITYINRCVAECQGADVEHEGACGAPAFDFKSTRGGEHILLEGAAGAAAAPAPVVDFSQVDAHGSVSAEELSRFSPHGYHLSAKLQLKARRITERGVKLAARGVAGPAPHPAANRTILTARLSKDGLLYLKPTTVLASEASSLASEGAASSTLPRSPAAATAIAQAASSSSSSSSSRRGKAGRKLLVVGEDDRTEVQNTMVYPFSAVGYLGYFGSDSESGCTATLIGPNVLITAGHCVYDSELRQFHDISSMFFFPARGGGPRAARSGRSVGIAQISTPFMNAGRPTECDDASLGATCQEMEDFFYDFAVVTLEESVGEEYGWLGIGVDCGFQVYSVATAGYPGDLADWPYRMFKTKGTLDGFRGCVEGDDLWNNVVGSDLDTAGGQSGSAVWDEDYVIRAVHVSGGPYERAVSSWVFNEVLEQMEDAGVTDEVDIAMLDESAEVRPSNAAPKPSNVATKPGGDMPKPGSNRDQSV